MKFIHSLMVWHGINNNRSEGDKSISKEEVNIGQDMILYFTSKRKNKVKKTSRPTSRLLVG